MPNDISKLNKELLKRQKAHDDLMSKYQNALFDIKKVKLDAQEERIKFKEQIFSLKQKVSSIECKVTNFEHKSSFSRSEYETLCQEIKALEAELKRRENQS